MPLILPTETSDSSWHIYVVLVNDKKTSIDRKNIFDRLRQLGVGVNVHYIPIHLQPFYQNNGFKGVTYENAENYYKKAITLPIFYGMTQKELTKIVTSLKSILS